MLKIRFIFIICSIIISFSCEKEEYIFGEIITPTDIILDIEIVGSSESKPYGDGTGLVRFNSSSKNGLSYKYSIDGVDYLSANGRLEHLFSKSGINKYNVNLVAVGTGGTQSSLAKTISVYVEYIPPPELITTLTLDNQRTWRMKFEAPYHFGLGPFEGTEPFAWYSAAPYEKDYTGMYDDRFTLFLDGNFFHDTGAESTIYGLDEYLDVDFGIEDAYINEWGEYEHYPLEDYSASWSLSAPGGIETLTISGNGFFSFYCGGNNQYKILERSPNEILLQTTEGDESLEWYIRLIAED